MGEENNISRAMCEAMDVLLKPIVALEEISEISRVHGIARENAMDWAMRTALVGEDPQAILARAQLYEEYVLGPVTAAP